MRLQVECFKFNVVSYTNEVRLITFAAGMRGEDEGENHVFVCNVCCFGIVLVWSWYGLGMVLVWSQQSGVRTLSSQPMPDAAN